MYFMTNGILADLFSDPDANISCSSNAMSHAQIFSYFKCALLSYPCNDPLIPLLKLCTAYLIPFLNIFMDLHLPLSSLFTFRNLSNFCITLHYWAGYVVMFYIIILFH